jgi:ribosomal protein L29
MAILKSKDIIKMSREEKQKKLEELKMELIKSKVNAAKGGGAKVSEIRRTIARLITLNK